MSRMALCFVFPYAGFLSNDPIIFFRSRSSQEVSYHDRAGHILMLPFLLSRAESAFKALALAIREAIVRDDSDEVPSTKGVLAV